MPPPSRRLAGKIALITGAGRGFGRAMALAYAREGARLAVNYHTSRAGAEEVAAEAGRLGADAIVRRLSELPLRRFGRVEDVAYCAIVLAADDAGYLTGQILHPSEGWVSG